MSVEDGNVRVHKVWCAIDCGFAVNPSGVITQMESAINYGLTAALYGEITFANGKVEQSNFHDYQILRINEAPEIYVTIVNSGEAHGRRRRARHAADRAGGGECDLRGDRQARAQAADLEEPGPMRILMNIDSATRTASQVVHRDVDHRARRQRHRRFIEIEQRRVVRRRGEHVGALRRHAHHEEEGRHLLP